LVPLSDVAVGVGVLLALLLEELGVLVVADESPEVDVEADVAGDVVDVLFAAELATPATRVAPRAAPAVATPAAVRVARRNTRFGRLGGGVVVMATTIVGRGSSQPQPTVKCASRSVRRRLKADWAAQPSQPAPLSHPRSVVILDLTSLGSCKSKITNPSRRRGDLATGRRDTS
jgi:hypothetical protein